MTGELVTRAESLRRLCETLGLPDWLPARTILHGEDRWPGYWEELVDAETGVRPVGMLRWVGRNEDKPHRCPECHRVVTWERKRYGPRSRLTCPPCGVQWRSGTRVYPRRLRAR